jgi:hypothetical protein
MEVFNLYDFPYGLYKKDDYIFANHHGKKITKGQIIMDLREIVKNKSKYKVNSFDKQFIQSLEAFGITQKELINNVIKYKEHEEFLTKDTEREFWKEYYENMEAINGRSINKSRNNTKKFTYTVKQ